MKKLNEIKNLKRSQPREFWKYFRNKNNKTTCQSISVQNIREYFSNLENDLYSTRNIEAKSFCADHNLNQDFNEDIDYDISNEVLKSVKKLKCHKAYGLDCLLNEYFIECSDILTPLLCRLFNTILNSGYFPDKWSKGL